MIFDNDDNITTIPGIIMMMKMNEKMKTRYQVEKINQSEYDEKKWNTNTQIVFCQKPFFYSSVTAMEHSLLWNE